MNSRLDHQPSATAGSYSTTDHVTAPCRAGQASRRPLWHHGWRVECLTFASARFSATRWSAGDFAAALNEFQTPHSAHWPCHFGVCGAAFGADVGCAGSLAVGHGCARCRSAATVAARRLFLRDAPVRDCPRRCVRSARRGRWRLQSHRSASLAAASRRAGPTPRQLRIATDRCRIQTAEQSH